MIVSGISADFGIGYRHRSSGLIRIWTGRYHAISTPASTPTMTALTKPVAPRYRDCAVCAHRPSSVSRVKETTTSLNGGRANSDTRPNCDIASQNAASSSSGVKRQRVSASRTVPTPLSRNRRRWLLRAPGPRFRRPGRGIPATWRFPRSSRRRNGYRRFPSPVPAGRS